MKISVVIPVHEKHKNDIRNTLMSLILQYRKHDEVILILSPPNSEFRHYIESLAKLLSLSYKLYKYLKKRPNNIAWIIISSYLSDIAYVTGIFIRIIKETFIWISPRFQ